MILGRFAAQMFFLDMPVKRAKFICRVPKCNTLPQHGIIPVFVPE